MNKPSIYASLGNKEALFKLVLKNYLINQLAFIDQAIAKATLSEVIDALFKGEIALLTQQDTPRGCLLVQAASGSKQNTSINSLLVNARKAIEAKLRKRIQLAQLKKDFSTKDSPSVLAKSILVIYEGISTQAATGSSEIELLNVAELSKKILS